MEAFAGRGCASWEGYPRGSVMVSAASSPPAAHTAPAISTAVLNPAAIPECRGRCGVHRGRGERRIGDREPEREDDDPWQHMQHVAGSVGSRREQGQAAAGHDRADAHLQPGPDPAAGRRRCRKECLPPVESMVAVTMMKPVLDHYLALVACLSRQNTRSPVRRMLARRRRPAAVAWGGCGRGLGSPGLARHSPMTPGSSLTLRRRLPPGGTGHRGQG